MSLVGLQSGCQGWAHPWAGLLPSSQAVSRNGVFYAGGHHAQRAIPQGQQDWQGTLSNRGGLADSCRTEPLPPSAALAVGCTHHQTAADAAASGGSHATTAGSQACFLMLQGDKVKSGQVLGYVEQLGTFVPIEVGVVFQSSVQQSLAGAQLGQPAAASP